VTAGNKKQAQAITEALIKNKLAACVNIIDNIESVFWWRGKVDKARELLLVIKSKKSKLSAIIKLVRSLHSYSVPEIIALPLEAGEKKYLDWIDDTLRKPH
jgi:periplasmic divalent cation tolerance protein